MKTSKYILIILLLFAFEGRSQDTLRLTMAGADSLFLRNNLSLLAQRYRMDANKAATLQARLFNNPTLTTEWNLYNPVKGKYFDVGAGGENIFAIDQVIQLAGKRNKRIQIAKENEVYGSFEFEDLLRTLKFELRDNFQTCYYNLLTVKKYDEQLMLLDTIIEALSYQSKKGNIPPKEVFRLQALYFQLNSDRSDLMSEYLESRKNLQVLLHTRAELVLSFTASEISRYKITGLLSDSLFSEGLRNRPDLRMATSDLRQNQLNYSLQRRSVVPDLHIGGLYDQAGSYINQYTGVTLGFDLPIWDRNQGNIRMALAERNRSEVLLKQKEQAVVNEIAATYGRLREFEKEYRKISPDFPDQIDQMNDGFISNFHRRNISLLEFVDFFESYNASILQLNKLTEKRIKAYEELNYMVGRELFN